MIKFLNLSCKILQYYYIYKSMDLIADHFVVNNNNNNYMTRHGDIGHKERVTIVALELLLTNLILYDIL